MHSCEKKNSPLVHLLQHYISSQSATLIDNIFTNNFQPSKSGIFINDISDHLPVFSCSEELVLSRVCEKSVKLEIQVR